MLKFIDFEKSERWLTKSERKLWKKKYAVFENWLKENDGEMTPLCQLRIKELLFLYFITLRVEGEWVKKLSENTYNSVPTNSQRQRRSNIAQELHLDYVEILGKYFEKLRKLLQEFEETISVKGKSKQGFSLAELVEDLIQCSQDLYACSDTNALNNHRNS